MKKLLNRDDYGYDYRTTLSNESSEALWMNGAKISSTVQFKDQVSCAVFELNEINDMLKATVL